TLPVLEDWDLWLRVFEIAGPIHVRRITSEVRQRENSSSLTWRSNDVWMEVFARIYEKTVRFERLDPMLRRKRVKNLISLGEQRGRAFPSGAVGWLRGDDGRPAIEPSNPLAAWGHSEEASSENRRPSPPRPEPSCSIVIPVLNCMDLTRQCLEKLFAVTDGVPFEVIVVDNGSDDETAEYLRSLGEKIRLISNPENQGFAIACNQGARAATGEYVVFLNNDTVPLRGWLRAMVDVVRTEPGVGIVGSKLLFPDRSVQHAGVAMSREYGTPYHIYRGVPEDAPVVSRRRDLNCVTAACMLVRRSAVQEVGGFDEGYLNGFEDIDLCFRMVERGYRVVYEPQSVLLHLESQTTGRKDHDPHNVRRFRERWSDPSWLDEERVYAEDGYVVVRTEPPGIRPFLDDDERGRWMRVAEVQFRAPREGLASVGTLLEPSEWPRERPILAWGESLCMAAGLPGLAARFRVEHDALPEDSWRPARA
ncbi:MAG: glycosyltransferase family 2 protein, partial [Myxococcota bacterium]